MAEIFLGFTCMQQQLTRTDSAAVAADSAHKLRAYFILCDAWDGLNVYARFDRSGLDPFDIALENRSVTVPHEVLAGAGSFDVSLFGEDADGMRLTSTRVTVPVARSVDYSDKPPIPQDPEDPTPSLLQSIEAKVNAAADSAAAAQAAADIAAGSAAATVEVGSVAAGETASVTNSGDSHNAVFDFVLPQGERGPQGIQGVPGASGVHIGADAPTETANVWIDPNGGPSGTEEWKFTLESGATVTKTVVVIS